MTSEIAATPQRLDVDEALAALVRAGEGDPDRMAAYLVEQGDTGYARSPGSCPVANYITRVTGQRVWVDVDIWQSIIDKHEGSVPESVGRLIDRIDSGSYLPLIAVARARP